MDGTIICLIIAAISISLIFFREIFLWLRNKIPKTVQCWFCHNKAQIEHRLSNSWYCTSCDQYNGFTKDGGYNKIVDNQFEEKLNFSVTSIGRNKDAWKSTKRLCESCNHNQELKVQQLAAFVPLNEKNYDIEIEHYRAQLEKCYKLCFNCEGLLSKIFSNERTVFSLPRRLARGLIIKPEVTGIGRCILYMNLLVSLILSITAYINLEGIPPMVAQYLKEYNTFKISWIFKSSYILPIGLILNICGLINKFSTGLLLNTISWLIVLILSANYNGFKHYIIALQAISGIISCGVSVICLTNNRRKSKNKYKSISMEGKQYNSSQLPASNPEVTPRYTPPCEEQVLQMFQKGARLITNNPMSTPPSSPKTPKSTVNIIKPQRNWSETINNGIRGLSLGTNAGMGIRNISRRDAMAGGGDAWWLNANRPKRTAPKVSTQNCFGPPSTNSSGFSDMADEVDDCASCTGHSPVCRHYSCQLTPSPSQYACFYAAHFQRLLYSTSPSPQLPQNTQSQLPAVWNPLSYIYTIPIIALIISNITLLWTIYNKETIKE